MIAISNRMSVFVHTPRAKALLLISIRLFFSITEPDFKTKFVI